LTRPQSLTQTGIQQQLLEENTVLLEFALGEKRSWLWAVTPAATSTYQLPPRKEIESAARKVYDLLTARQPKAGLTEAEQIARIKAADAVFQTEAVGLSQLLFGQIAGPLRRELKGKRLLIVSSGALEYLPFAALPIPSNDSRYEPLIAGHEIVNLPSASVLSAIRRETAGRAVAPGTVAILADPVFEPNDPRLLMAMKRRAGNQEIALNTRSAAKPLSSPAGELNHSPFLRAVRGVDGATLSRLPFSGEEADAIADLVPARSRLKATDFQATRRQALSIELSNYRIVHFATHGLLNSQHPELSGLVLSLVDENGKAQDGFLRMHEIYNLRLPAEVVVLSACQTGLGKEIKGEGLIGLTRGFMYAGAQRVVASLWQVDDLATAQLMKHFYQAMLKDGLRPAAALRSAQLELMKEKRWSSPYFWGAFMLQGEWK
jgi:CHAT domain-containing protein